MTGDADGDRGPFPSPAALPDGLFIRYDRPHESIAEAITSYHIYTCDSPEERVDWFLPGTADIAVWLDAGPIAVSIRRRTYDPLPQASLFGPSSQAMRAVTRGGTLIGIGLTALGWSRLFSRPASDFRDRAVPLAEATSPALAADLVATLDATDRKDGVRPALDAFMARHLGAPHPDTPHIRALLALIVDGRVDGLADLTRELGLPAHTLRRLAARHFGFPPKLLLLRARFLRSLIRIMQADGELDYSRLDGSYYDASHFLRDARSFLGTTPKRFLSQPTTFLRGSLEVRRAVLGAPAQVLHRIAAVPLDASRPAP